MKRMTLVRAGLLTAASDCAFATVLTIFFFNSTFMRFLPTLTMRWWVQLVGHIPFVALPITWTARKAVARS